MDPISGFLNLILSFLLQFVTLIINFIISCLDLLLAFLRAIVGMSH